VELPPDAARQVLERWPVAHLVTLDASGRPAPVPVVFARARGRLWTAVDGKPKRGGELARVRNVRRDPRVSLLLDHYDADWRLLWWLRVDGAAALHQAGPGDDAAVAEAVAALRSKYPQYAETPLFRGAPALLSVAVERTTGWCAGPAALAALDRAAGAPPAGDVGSAGPDAGGAEEP
jgi:PPOX class probable F420-dependent enzyme